MRQFMVLFLFKFLFKMVILMLCLFVGYIVIIYMGKRENFVNKVRGFKLFLLIEMIKMLYYKLFILVFDKDIVKVFWRKNEENYGVFF